MNSFPFVQVGTAIGPYSGSPSVSFPSNVSFGNIIAVNWYAQGNTGQGYPTGVSDSLGNYYKLKSQGNGDQAVQSERVQMYIAQGNPTTKYGGIAGGPCTITFTGAVVNNSTGPSLICCEYETPEYYQIYGTNVDSGHVSSNYQVTFRSIINNGGPGGGNASDTGDGHTGSAIPSGLLSIGAVPINTSFPDSVNNNLVSVMLINPGVDVVILYGNYNTFFPEGWMADSGTIIRAQVFQTDGGESAVFCDEEFPYLNGPLIAQCGDDPNGVVGIAYDTTVLASGGTGSYTFTLTGGILPPGLTLNTSTGDISGTPTASGKFSFTILVSDGSTSVTLDCVISICPAGSTGGGNVAYYSRH